jgi:hypothetical protein
MVGWLPALNQVADVVSRLAGGDVAGTSGMT